MSYPALKPIYCRPNRTSLLTNDGPTLLVLERSTACQTARGLDHRGNCNRGGSYSCRRRALATAVDPRVALAAGTAEDGPLMRPLP